MSSALFAAVAYALFSALVLYIAYRLVRALAGTAARLLTRDGAALGSDPRVRLLALGGAVLLFPETVTQAVRGTLMFLVHLFEQFPANLAQAWQGPARVCENPESAAQCVSDTWFSLLEVFGRSFMQAFRNAGWTSFPWANLLLASAAWVLWALVLAALLPPLPPRPIPAAQPRRGWFRRRREAPAVAPAPVPAPPHPVPVRATPTVRRLSRRLRVLSRQITPVTRQNFLFFLLLSIGAYLSIAAIGAIPDLQAEVEELRPPLAPAALEQRLAVSSLAARTDTAPDPQQRLKALLCSHPEIASDALCAPAAAESAGADVRVAAAVKPGTGAPAGAAPNTGPSAPAAADSAARVGPGGTARPAVLQRDSALGPEGKITAIIRRMPAEQLDSSRVAPYEVRSVAMAVRALDEAREQRIRAHTDMVRDATTDLASARARARDAYEGTAAGRSRARVKEQYFYQLTEWYADRTDQHRRQLARSRADLDEFDRFLARWSMVAREQLQQPTEAFRSGYGDSHQVLLEGARQRASPPAVFHLTSSRKFPPRPSAGYGLGPFEFVSGWLLGTESLALAMITGMLGFGLLGAAASTFVRDQLESGGKPDREPNQPLVKDLAGVVIRGGSAAIVVFLGVMGGLAIFSVNDDPRPNAYVLLFTCLAGAVFSDTVWRWAEKRLGSQFPNDGGTGANGAERAGGTPTPPPPANAAAASDPKPADGESSGPGGAGESASATPTPRRRHRARLPIRMRRRPDLAC